MTKVWLKEVDCNVPPHNLTQCLPRPGQLLLVSWFHVCTPGNLHHTNVRVKDCFVLKTSGLMVKLIYLSPHAAIAYNAARQPLASMQYQIWQHCCVPTFKLYQVTAAALAPRCSPCTLPIHNASQSMVFSCPGQHHMPAISLKFQVCRL